MVVRLYTLKIKLGEDLMQLAVSRVAKARVPEIRVVVGEEAVAGDAFIYGRAQRVEITGGVTSEQNRPRSEILD